MSETIQYDAIVIGSGQAGKPLSIELARAGRRTALIERSYIGGTCINYGCTPTKTMAASARIAYLARRASDYGVHSGEVTVSMAEVRRRKQSIVESFRDGGLKSIKETKGLDLVRGEAEFRGQHELRVLTSDGNTLALAADKIFINTGARPAKPRIEGLDNISTLDSTSIMELEDLPGELLVLGGGYVGLEFGQMFHRFGSRVTIIQRGQRLLDREDPDIADNVRKILTEDGIEVLLETEARRVGKTAESLISLDVRTGEGIRSVRGTHLLVAVGRQPNTDSLNLETAGVETDSKGFIKVTDRLETNVPGVYALGDVKGGPAFTHISYDDYRVIRTNLIEGGNATIKGRLVPYTVFIDPQLGRVGLTESQARDEGRNIRVATLPMTSVARAIEFGETRGLMKAVVDADTNQILGCAVLGFEGGEMMAMFEIAMMGQIPYTKLKDGIFAHPTLAEALNNLFAAMDR